MGVDNLISCRMMIPSIARGGNLNFDVFLRLGMESRSGVEIEKCVVSAVFIVGLRMGGV